MSVEISGRIWKGSKAKGNNRLMLLAIADNAGDEGIAWPGIVTLAKKMGGMSRRAAGQRIVALSKTKELAVFPRKGGSHEYIVLVGMTRTEVKIAYRKLAVKRRVTVGELIYLRRFFAGSKMRESSRVPVGKSSQGVRRSPDTNRKEPSLKPSTQHPAAALWEKETNTPAPIDASWERFKYAVETQPEANIIAAIKIGKERQAGKPSMAYVLGILKRGVEPAKLLPPVVDRKPARIYR